MRDKGPEWSESLATNIWGKWTLSWCLTFSKLNYLQVFPIIRIVDSKLSHTCWKGHSITRISRVIRVKSKLGTFSGWLLERVLSTLKCQLHIRNNLMVSNFGSTWTSNKNLYLLNIKNTKAKSYRLLSLKRQLWKSSLENGRAKRDRSWQGPQPIILTFLLKKMVSFKFPLTKNGTL